MENNNKDFMKNSPVVSQANQYQDVYGSAKSSTREVLSVILSIILLVCSLYCYFTARYIQGTVFLVIFIALLVSAFVGNKADRYNNLPAPDENSESIFKEHED